MVICIDKGFLGTSRHLILGSDSSVWWSSNSKADVTLGGRDGIPYDDVSLLLGRNSKFNPENYRSHLTAFRQLGVDTNNLPWKKVLGPNKFRVWLEKIVVTVKSTVSDFEDTGYFQTYRQAHNFLQSLERPNIDTRRLLEHVEKNDSGSSVKNTLLSFKPQSDGRADPITYSTVHTTTGRMTVRSGPSILTLPAQCRNIISSDRGSVYQVDFVSLEPKVMLYSSGSSVPNDVYIDMMEKIPELGDDRRAAKLASLSALYGSGPYALSGVLGDIRSAKKAIKRVKEYFAVTEIAKKLKIQLSKCGKINNYYGRPLYTQSDSDSKLINHFIQSSAVDTALLGFMELMKGLRDLGVVPHYIIHDAIIVDVPEQHEEMFMSVCSQGINPGIGHLTFKVTKV